MVIPGLAALALLAVVVGAVTQAATGMGFSLVSAPFLVLALGPREGVATTVVLAALASVAPLLQNRRHVHAPSVVRLLVPTLLLTPVLAWAVRDVGTRWLGLAGGVGIVVAVALLASGLRSAWLRRTEGLVATGAASAALNVIGGVGGPPVGLYAANSDWPATSVRANLQAFFLVQNVVTAVALGVRLPGWPLLLALVVGTSAGLVLADRLAAGAVRTGVLGVSLAGGVWLIAGAV